MYWYCQNYFTVSQPQFDEIRDPCVPSPCGQNALCHTIGEQAACSCSPGYFGSPPNCKPECTTNEDCISSLACTNEKCIDPCLGSCGKNAKCVVIMHVAICSCLEGYNGDPFSACEIKPVQGI